MNSYKEITDKYLKHNKKRTILTICGIILSVALITSIGLFIESMQNTFVKEAIESSGSYHVSIKDTDDKAYERIKNNPKIDKVGLRENLDSIYLTASKGIDLIKIDKNASELLPYKTIEGRLPKKEGELAVEKWILNYIKNSPKLGDSIKLKLSDGSTKEFKLIGIITNNSYNQFTGKSTGIVYSNKFNISKSNIYLTISKKANITNTVKELEATFKNASSNEELLRLLGESQNKSINKSLYTMVAIIISVVVIATIAVIYNSFQISVIERIKQFGLLRAVGATPRQVRSIVLREATLISLIAIPIGLCSGITALYIISQVFKMMSGSVMGNLEVVISYKVLIISAAVGLFSVYVSALVPARFAGKVSPLVAISSRKSIVKEKINKKRGKIAKKFLRINSLMAFKNIKRNRKRFNITVFSIIISVFLFIFFSSFINMTSNFTPNETESSNAHFQVVGLVDKTGKSSLNKDIVEKIKGNNKVKDVDVSYNRYLSKALILNNKRDAEIEKISSEIYKKANLDGKEMTSLDLIFDIYDDNKLEKSKKYITSGSIDKEKMNKENGVIIIKNNIIRREKGYYEGGLTNLKVGDSFYVYKNAKITEDNNLNNNNIKNFNKDNMVKVKVMAIVDDAPYSFYGGSSCLKLIVSKSIVGNLYNNIDKEKIPYKSADIILNNKNDENNFEKWIQPLADNSGIRVINEIKQNEAGMSSMLQVKILMYGFIAVISLIGAVNIINTITTNLILRRKEIASLSALGMTYKNIRSMILTEGILYGLYGCFYGGIIGSVLSYMISSPMRELKGFKWQIPWGLIGIATLAAISISLLSVIKPLNRIKKENIIEVIRTEE